MSNQKRTLTELFCLTGLFLDRTEIEGDLILLHVRSPRLSAACPKCGKSTKRVSKRITRQIKHGFCDNRLVVLRITLRDFRCSKCGLFRESISGIDRRRTTARFRALVIPKIRDRSFSAVAKEFGLSASSLIRSANDLLNKTLVPWPDEPFALGIDEHSFAGHDLVITLTDVTHHKLLGILKDDRNSSLSFWLQNMPENIRQSIKSACMDMHGGYSSVMEKVLPEVPVVIDKFHVIQHFNFHLQQLRLLYTSSAHPLPKQLLEKNKEDLTAEEKEEVKIIFEQYPAIAEFWRLKEIMRDIYRMKKPEEARRRFDSMLDGLELDPRRRWQELYRTLSRWRNNILNYFSEGRITNAYTEGVHTRIKLLKRISYGFRNKTNYIAKMTLAFLPLAAILEALSHHLV